jgi:hypothetical protein
MPTVSSIAIDGAAHRAASIAAKVKALGVTDADLVRTRVREVAGGPARASSNLS